MIKQKRYRIWCCQRNQYFADGVTFDNLNEIKEQLIDYHSPDSEENLQKLSLSDILGIFEWEIHTEDGEVVVIDELKELVAEKIEKIEDGKTKEK